MKKVSPISNEAGESAVRPFRIHQALIALELGAPDEAVLNFMDFLSTQVPVDQAHFLHVLPGFDLFNALYERERESLISNYEINEEVTGEMSRRIRHRMTTLPDKRIQFEVREGNPLEELLHEATAQEADLVVIGQKSGTEQHGILARNLVRKVSCNALVIPQKAENRLRRILVPIDFSPHSVEALRTALSIRRQVGEAIQITCLNVFDMPNFNVYRIQKSRMELKRMLEEDRMEAFRGFLHTYAPDEENTIQTALLDREHPGIASYILEYASAQEIDLLIMGARGHSKVELLLLGSVTEKLLTANEHIPTLVVKDKVNSFSI